MMIIKVKGKYSDEFLLLGVQTNKDNVQKASEEKAKAWSPKKAKSFNMEIYNTDYEGHRSDNNTGYANITVSYFTTTKEGKYKINT